MNQINTPFCWNKIINFCIRKWNRFYTYVASGNHLQIFSTLRSKYLSLTLRTGVDILTCHTESVDHIDSTTSRLGFQPSHEESVDISPIHVTSEFQHACIISSQTKTAQDDCHYLHLPSNSYTGLKKIWWWWYPWTYFRWCLWLSLPRYFWFR